MTMCVPGVSRNEVHLVHRAVNEGTEVKLLTCMDPPRPFAVSGTINGIPAGDSVIVWGGGGGSVGGDSYRLLLPAGPTELLAVMRENPSKNTVAVFRSPTIDVESDQTLSIDMSTQALAPIQVPLTVTPDDPSATTRTRLGPPSLGLPLSSIRPIGSPGNYLMLPPVQRQPNDLFTVEVTASDRKVATITSGAPLALLLPDPYAAPPPALLEQPYRRAAFQVPVVEGNLPVTEYVLNEATSAQFWVLGSTSCEVRGWVSDPAG
jgi:hypothetical protein